MEVAIDASTGINFLLLDRADLLGRLDGVDFHIPVEAMAEIEEHSQQVILTTAFERGHLQKTSLSGTEELASYAELRTQLGRGESACIAIAEHRGWAIACDDRRACRIAEGRLGSNRIFNTPGILLTAIQQGHLTCADADAVKATLAANRFTMSFSSFEELVGTRSKEGK